MPKWGILHKVEILLGETEKKSMENWNLHDFIFFSLSGLS